MLGLVFLWGIFISLVWGGAYPQLVCANEFTSNVSHPHRKYFYMETCETIYHSCFLLLATTTLYDTFLSSVSRHCK